MRISDWSSDVCSSDLESAPDSCSLRRIFLHLVKLPLKIRSRNHVSQPIAVFTNDLHEVACALRRKELFALQNGEFTLFQLLEYVLPSSLSSEAAVGQEIANLCIVILRAGAHHRFEQCAFGEMRRRPSSFAEDIDLVGNRSEEHTSELQSLMRISYAVFCLKKKIHTANY